MLGPHPKIKRAWLLPEWETTNDAGISRGGVLPLMHEKRGYFRGLQLRPVKARRLLSQCGRGFAPHMVGYPLNLMAKCHQPRAASTLAVTCAPVIRCTWMIDNYPQE